MAGMTDGIEALMRMGQWEAARVETEKLLLDHPASAKLRGYVGLCYYRLGNFEAAAAQLRQATCLDERFVDAGVKLVQALDRLQRYDEALEAAEQFAKVDPNNDTLIHLINGLQRQVPKRVTDSWELSIMLDRHEVKLASEADD
jgi:tetratricopeptide (TPR) repeat protein